MTRNSLSKKTHSAIDLFAGCGGLSLGLERAGFTIKAAVEIEITAAQTYQKNHSATVVIQSDIRRVSGAQLRRASGIGKGALDLLAGCPPCQGFSRIRRKNGATKRDPRNDLVFDFIRIAKELNPRIVLLENVPGFDKDRRFSQVIKHLKMAGYSCNWAILNAKDFGVPQRRNRLIVIASRIGEITMPCGGAVRKTVRDSIGNLESPSETKDPLHRVHLKNTPRIKQFISKIPVDGGSRMVLGKNAQLQCHKNFQGFKDVYGRMRWDDVAPTITGGCCNPSKGRFLHPQENRGITLREAALLQTFPKKYYFPHGAGLTRVARLIGDALPPMFAQRQGQHLMKHIAQMVRD